MPEDEDPSPQAPAIASIGRSVTISGDISGEEDLYVEGRVEGRVELPQHHVIIGPHGVIQGQVLARQVTVVGQVDGNVTVTERLEVCDTGIVDGDVTTPRLLVREGATVNGTMTMVAKTPPAKRPAPLKATDAGTAIPAVDEAAVYTEVGDPSTRHDAEVAEE